MKFTYEGHEFEGRQTEANNIVWLAGYPDTSEKMPRSFTFEEVAESFLQSYSPSEIVKKNRFKGMEGYFGRFEEYKPRAVIRQGKEYSWALSNATAEELKEFDDKADQLIWTPALAGEAYMIDLNPSMLMTRERAEAEALEIAKHLKIALEKI